MPTNKNALFRFQVLDRCFCDFHHKYDTNNLLDNGNFAIFICVVNGIDCNKVYDVYQNFIEGNKLISEKEAYLKNRLDYVNVNGGIETPNLTEYAFKAINWHATFSNHFVNLKDFVKQIHQVISVTA